VVKKEKGERKGGGGEGVFSLTKPRKEGGVSNFFEPSGSGKGVVKRSFD